MIEAILKDAKPDAEKKSCYDCGHCKASVSWWCVNKDAVAAHGTSIPGFANCEFWKAARTWDELSWFERTFGDFVILPGEKPAEVEADKAATD